MSISILEKFKVKMMSSGSRSCSDFGRADLGPADEGYHVYSELRVADTGVTSHIDVTSYLQ